MNRKRKKTRTMALVPGQRRFRSATVFVRLAAAMGLLLIEIGTASASKFQVNPIRVFLSPKKSSDLLNVRNESNEALRFQLSVYGWKQSSNGEELLSSTDDIVFFPSLLSLAPGEERKVRIGTVATRTAVEKSYRLFVEELPAQKREAPELDQVLVLTRLGIPIFVQPEKLVSGQRIEDIAVRKGVLSFTLSNTGKTHVLPQKILVKGYAATGEAFFERELPSWYVLAGGSRVYRLDLPNEYCEKTKAVSVGIQEQQKSFVERIEIRPGSCHE
jgi:fimbrial chaperone protein